jgi:hypothetical protein
MTRWRRMMNRAAVFRGFPNVKISMSEPWYVYKERKIADELGELCTLSGVSNTTLSTAQI